MSVREIALGLLMQADDEDGGSKNIIAKSITANGTYNAADDNADGYNPVTVNVQLKLAEKNIIKNGTYKAADDDLDGYSVVYVNVPQDWNNAKNLLDPPKDDDGNIIPSESEDGKIIIDDGGAIVVDPASDRDDIRDITSGIGSLDDDTPIYYTDTEKHIAMKIYMTTATYQGYAVRRVQVDYLDLEKGTTFTNWAQGWCDNMPHSVGARITGIDIYAAAGNTTAMQIHLRGYDKDGRMYTHTLNTVAPANPKNTTWISTTQPRYITPD